MRVLGIDVGSVRIGVALSDPLGMIAQPIEVIERKKTNAAERLRDLVKEHEATCVVVGMPLTLAGQAGLAASAVKEFTDELRLHIEIPIEFWDERLSTVQAERSMIQGNAKRKKRRNKIDQVAAALILQSYLDAQNMKRDAP